MARKRRCRREAKRVYVGTPHKRIMAVGCSHGRFIDPVARQAVIDFRKQFNPHECIHLGDFIDTASFRAGAAGTHDESEDIDDDLLHGLTFLQELRPTHLTLGNHDWRLWKFKDANNAQVRKAARDCIVSIEKTCKQLHCNIHPYLAVWGFTDPRSFVEIGGYRYAHGSFYGEHATRDYAEKFGNVVHAHTHRPAVATGRRGDFSIAFCPGALMNAPSAEYANARAVTLAWGCGVIKGEYTTGKRSKSYLSLSIMPRGTDHWRIF